MTVPGCACSGKIEPVTQQEQRLSAGECTKGARLYDWAYCELADLDACEYDDQRAGLWTRGLLIRRTIADGDMAFFSTWCPAGTGIATLDKVEGHRWAIEDSFETAKNELGLDHNEMRSWHGWHRHVSLVTLAFAMMAIIRHRPNKTPPQKRKSGQRPSFTDPLVGARNPPRRDEARSKTHQAHAHPCIVALAKSPSSRGKTRALQIKIATVMLTRASSREWVVHLSTYSQYGNAADAVRRAMSIRARRASVTSDTSAGRKSPSTVSRAMGITLSVTPSQAAMPAMKS
jgi:hypothetical protein